MMKRMGILFVVLIILGLTAGVTAFAAGPIIVTLAGAKPEGEPETLGMHKFAEVLATLSNGKYHVRVSPDNQLGNENTYIAKTRAGSIQMCATGTQASAIFPAMAMLEAPMLFSDLTHARRAMEGKTFDLINAGFPEKSGLRAMNAFPLGFRHFYSKKPLENMDDLKDARMRVPNIPLYINFAKECGINGQPMPFADITSALAKGTIDGGDSPFADIVALKMYKTAPHITLSGHILAIHSLYINEKFYKSLPASDKHWFDQAAKESAAYVWDLMAGLEKEAVQTIMEGGGIVSTPSPEFHEAMKAAGERSWKLLFDTVPNAREILASADSYR